MQAKYTISDFLLNIQPHKYRMFVYSGNDCSNLGELFMKRFLFALAFCCLYIETLFAEETVNSLVDAIYVINLDRNPERFDYVKKQFDEIGLKIQRFSAVDGKKLTLVDKKTGDCFTNKDAADADFYIKNENKEFQVVCESRKEELVDAEFTYFSDNRQNFGELGCFMSHRAIYADMLKKGYSKVIILEDDVKIFKNFKEDVCNVLRNIPTNADLVFLDLHIKKLSMKYWLDRFFSFNIPYLFKIRYSTNICGTHAYVVTNKGAKKLLERTSFTNIPIDFCVCFDRTVYFYVAKSKLCTAGEIGSIIGEYGCRVQGY